MASSEMAPREERESLEQHSEQQGHPERLRYGQLRDDVLDAYEILKKNAITLDKHTKTLAKHGTSLRWVKRAQADHTIRLQRLETKMDGLETKVDGLETKVDGLETKVDGLETKVDGRFDEVQTQLDTIIGLLDGGAAR